MSKRKKTKDKMIKLKNDYGIVSDGTQYKLVKACKKMVAVEKGSDEKVEVDAIDNIGYHATLETALKQYVRECVISKVAVEDLELKDVKRIMEELKAEIACFR